MSPRSTPEAVFVNGFLPYTVGAGGKGTFLLNVASIDLQVSPSGLPVLVFIRGQALPRWNGNGSETRFLLQQAFGRVSPFSSQELSISAGRFDSVFGIEYLENESNLRLGITPSLIARYTTGHPLGIKLFYRFQLPSIASAIFDQRRGHQPRLAGRVAPGRDPELHRSARGERAARVRASLLGTELKLGVSGLYGPRNDQPDPGVTQRQLGFDARVFVGPFSVWAEYVDVDEEPATAPPKPTGTGVLHHRLGIPGPRLLRPAGVRLAGAREGPVRREPLREVRPAQGRLRRHSRAADLAVDGGRTARAVERAPAEGRGAVQPRETPALRRWTTTSSRPRRCSLSRGAGTWRWEP
jgi:hypothetical protein